MPIEVKGAKEHNLNIDQLVIEDGLTVVTGVSGSGKSSLVFNTIFYEANRLFHDAFGLSSKSKFNPALVNEITGLKPSIAIDQNVLNRNPNSTLASASGIHPLLRILYSRFGVRVCGTCYEKIQIFSKEEVINYILSFINSSELLLKIPIVKNQAYFSDTLLTFLKSVFPNNSIELSYESMPEENIDKKKKVSILIELLIKKNEKISEIRSVLDNIEQLGYQTITINSENLSWGNSCPNCQSWLETIEPKIFHTPCPFCKGKKCQSCNFTGMHPLSLTITWQSYPLSNLLELTVKNFANIFISAPEKNISQRLKNEIMKRLGALITVGLEYLDLSRPMPTLSRGEAQRVRLALALINNLEDMLYILDEPTIGLHIKNVLDLMPEFRKLKGSTIFVEHDKLSAASADYAIDIGPGAGFNGGKVVFNGTAEELWKSSTITGKYFSNTSSSVLPRTSKKSKEFLVVMECFLRNLKSFNLRIPLNQFIVVTGVSGSGKTTLVRDVVIASLLEKKPVGCKQINPINLKPILVDQSPIGKNPRSNPATYTKLADLLRDEFSKRSNLRSSYFSFNNQEGACPECNGLGSIEVKMTYLPSTWITCDVCQGKKFNETVLDSKITINGKLFNIDDILSMSIEEANKLLSKSNFFESKIQKQAENIFKTLIDIGLGYLELGQPSPTLSGGEAQRIKLTKFLSKSNIKEQIIVLDEPSTGLHPADISGLIKIFDRLLQKGASIIVIEHNSDIIRMADWIVDLGPGSGENGGELIYSGNYEGLILSKTSITSEMLKIEHSIGPVTPENPENIKFKKDKLLIKHAKVHNLQDISVEIPKNALTIITGVSGSGKSSLITDIIETEARRRFLESLSMYERQSIHEGAEVDSEVEGLGVTFSLQAKKERYYLRNTVGYTTEISQQLAILFAELGEQYCETCKKPMKKEGISWKCIECGRMYSLATPRHFSARNYSSACLTCHGIGTKSVPNPNKLIINPEKPICKGAMYSPGFFPKGYLCKEGNGGYYWLRAVGALFNFDPDETPWNEMSEEAQKAFLFGTDDILEYKSFGLKGNSHFVKEKNRGYYGFIREWDVGGTYTDREICPTCNGAGLRPQYTNIQLIDKNYDDLQILSLDELASFTKLLEKKIEHSKILQVSYNKLLLKLTFLCKVGLHYLNLRRTMGTLSAGESQRIKLAGLLGSNLQGLTIILDEPTRGMHPSEVSALINVLQDLRNVNNTILVIEHDLDVIKSGDYLIELGPKSGKGGGKIVNIGTLNEFAKNASITATWLGQNSIVKLRKKKKFVESYLKLYGARENNLKGDTLEIPLHKMVGICGVSGSGKSTLIVDTLSRIIAPEKHTTSVAYEPIQPGKYDSIEDAPKKTIVIDQVKKGISSPFIYLELDKVLIDMFKNSDDFVQSELEENIFKKKCSACKGEGLIKTDMGFLPPIYAMCDTCSGTGLIAELWSIKVNGYSLPELFSMTLDEIAEINTDDKLKSKLDVVKSLGLGYLVLKQPVYSLSGGEVQRLKIAKELLKKAPSGTLFILDEPSLGLHMEDIKTLLAILYHLVEKNNTVLIIEHNPYILASCDWLVELGPVGGSKGGYIINTGTPEEFSKQDTPTSKYIKELIKFDG